MIGRIFAGAALLVALTACASTGGGGSGAGYDRERLTREQLEESPASNLYDVVRTQRPAWLRTQANSRMGSAAVGPMVYLDGQALGEADVMRSISTTSVESVRRLSASQAQSRYSMSDARVVLDVISRKAP